MATTLIASRPRVTAILRDAADHLDAVGLYQGALFAPGPDGYRWVTAYSPEAAVSPCCAHGAVEYTARHENHSLRVHVAANTFDAYVRDHHADELAALRDAVNDDGEQTDAARLATFQRDGAAWNDAPGRTKDEVVAALRAAADAHEAGTL